METTARLPNELILKVALHLESAINLPTWSIDPSSNSNSNSLNSSFRTSSSPAFINKRPSTHSTLLSLSSACQPYRTLLSPIIWNQIYITNPNQLGRLRSLISFYTTVSNQEDRNVRVANRRLPFPLPLIQHLFINLDDRFQSFPQDILCQLLKNGMNRNLKSISWNSEALPNPALWVALEENTNLAESREECQDEMHSFQIGEGNRAESKGLQSLEVDCKTFWGGHLNLSRLRSLRHLRLTSFDSYLLPTHLPLLLSSLSKPLLSLSLSTSKTSLLHDLSPSLLSISLSIESQDTANSNPSKLNIFKTLARQTEEGRGPFSNLVELDIFPVTPENPLDESLIQSGKTLKHLRICLDVSGAFGNFDKLWISMIDRMEVLESLDVEPYPQQNTAPSFQTFVDSCPKLYLINGRRIDQLPPCLTPFDPDHRTSALAY